MSIHIEAKQGEIADKILLPGDPLRAKHVAEKFLTDVTCYNQVRNMFGYTGIYKGTRISVQGTGMGMPSASIYINELVRDYGVKELIRIGTSGALRADVHVKDVVMALAASTNSAMHRSVFGLDIFAATADFGLVLRANKAAEKQKMPLKAGNVLSSDQFYEPDPSYYVKWAEHGVLCVEMETSALYTIAARNGAHALSLLTISDHVVTGESCTAAERQNSFDDMVRIALDTLL